MLDKVKVALRITSDAYNTEINDLIAAALSDLELVGISAVITDSLILRAVITYCRAHFSSPADYDKLKASYDEQKAQLISSTAYRSEGDEW